MREGIGQPYPDVEPSTATALWNEDAPRSRVGRAAKASVRAAHRVDIEIRTAALRAALLETNDP
jgi:hypothetical protein